MSFKEKMNKSRKEFRNQIEKCDNTRDNMNGSINYFDQFVDLVVLSIESDLLEYVKYHDTSSQKSVKLFYLVRGDNGVKSLEDLTTKTIPHWFRPDEYTFVYKINDNGKRFLRKIKEKLEKDSVSVEYKFCDSCIHEICTHNYSAENDNPSIEWDYRYPLTIIGYDVFSLNQGDPYSEQFLTVPGQTVSGFGFLIEYLF